MKSTLTNEIQYLDYHYLQTIASSRSIRFSLEEINAAAKEMDINDTFISSISKNGISLGKMPGNDKSNMHPAAYANDMWLECLEWGSTEEGGVEFLSQISLPGWILFALNTPFENEASDLSYKFSKIFLLHESEEVVIDFHNEAEALKEKLSEIGLLNTTKKSIHVTKRAVEAMDAGTLSQSNRILTIIERYTAIMKNPELALQVKKMHDREMARKQELLDMPF